MELYCQPTWRVSEYYCPNKTLHSLLPILLELSLNDYSDMLSSQPSGKVGRGTH